MAILLTGASIISTVNSFGCAQPVNATYPIAFGFVVLAIVLFESRDRAPLGEARGRLAAAFLAMFAGVMGCGAAVAVWPALVLSAWRGPANRALAGATLLAGLLAAIALFDFGSGGQTATHFSLGHCWKMIEYLILYSAMPWSMARLPLALRFLVGAGALLIGAALLWRGPRRSGPSDRLERIGLDLIAFALATGVMAAVGRVDENPAVLIPMRYIVFMSAFVAGLICIMAPWLAQRWTGVRKIASPLVVLSGFALLMTQVGAGAALIKTSVVIRRELQTFEAGRRTPLTTAIIHHDLGFADQVYLQLRQRRLYGLSPTPATRP
jgi:hypothetical protein